jgi:hypothetical protein
MLKIIIKYLVTFIEYLVIYPTNFFIVGYIFSMLKIPSFADFYLSKSYYTGSSSLGIGIGIVMLNYIFFCIILTLILGLLLQNTITNRVMKRILQNTNRFKSFFYVTLKFSLSTIIFLSVLSVFYIDSYMVKFLAIIALILISTDIYIDLKSKSKKDLISTIIGQEY